MIIKYKSHNTERNCSILSALTAFYATKGLPTSQLLVENLYILIRNPNFIPGKENTHTHTNPKKLKTTSMALIGFEQSKFVPAVRYFSPKFRGKRRTSNLVVLWARSAETNSILLYFQKKIITRYYQYPLFYHQTLVDDVTGSPLMSYAV